MKSFLGISAGRTALIALGFGIVALVACGSESGEEQPPHNQGAGAGSSNSGGSSSSGDDPLMTSNGSSGSGMMEECANAEAEATFIPVNMFITVDKSGSMNQDNKWNNAKAAFIAFFQDPEADTMNVALRFWPDDGCTENTCDANLCGTPQVAMGSLEDPVHEQALINLFNSKSPDGNTPMSAALAGATQYACNNQQTGEIASKTVAVLVTDGEPNGCDENVTNIAAIAGNAYSTCDVLTFAVGLAGSNEITMNMIASSGGTTEGFKIGNGNAEADLLAALKAIQETVLACSFAMPESDDPTTPVDPSEVNIVFTAGDGTETTLKQVASADDCTTAEGGWFYDDPENPATIEFCESTCQLVQSDEAGSVKIVLGCATEVQ